VLAAAGCVLAGGHSIDAPEPTYGFAVTGVVHPDRVVRNTGGRPGDVLVLTKPIGTGLIATGIKRGVATVQQRDAAVGVMKELNEGAMRAMQAVGARAATDVTGFGLLGHLGEMLGDSVGAEISAGAVPVLDGARDLAAGGVVPGGTHRNLDHAGGFVDFGLLDDVDRLVLSDAQTNGGLLIAVPEARTEALLAALSAERTAAAAVVGRISSDRPGSVIVGA